jgi:predicted amidohydrolase
MFDVTVDGVEYQESAREQRGDHLVLADMGGIGVGMSICYDLRFPEVYRALALAGASIFTVPSCFTRRTGQDHWEVLLRARAIENACYVLAPNIIGDHGDGRESYGRSMIIDPWGTVLATAPDQDSVIVADLDMALLERVRRSIPALKGRIAEAYAVR